MPDGLLCLLLVSAVRSRVEGTLVVEGEVDVFIGRTVRGIDGHTVDLLGSGEDVGSRLRLSHIDLAVLDRLDHGHRIAVVADRDSLDLGLHRSGVLVVEFEGDVLSLFELRHLVRTVVDQKVLILRHRGEVEPGVPRVRDLRQGLGVLVLDRLEDRVLALLGIVDSERLLRDDMRGHTDAVGTGAELGLPVSVGLGVFEGDLFAVIGDLGELLDQCRSGGRRVEVDGLRVVLLDRSVVVVVGFDGVEVRRGACPGQRQVSGVDGGAVGPLGIVVEGVLALERVFLDLLDLAERAFLNLLVVVVVPDVVIHNVCENGVRVALPLAVNVFIDRKDSFHPMLTAVSRCVVVASARGCAGGEHHCSGSHRGTSREEALVHVLSLLF